MFVSEVGKRFTHATGEFQPASGIFFGELADLEEWHDGAQLFHRFRFDGEKQFEIFAVLKSTL